MSDNNTMMAAGVVKATIARLSGILRVLELTRADEEPADPDLLLVLEEAVSDQIETLEVGVLRLLDPLGELSRKPTGREAQP